MQFSFQSGKDNVNHCENRLAGKSACGKKKQSPPGVTAGKGWSRASHEEPERGTNGGDGEPPKGASSKVAAPYQAEGKEAEPWGCCDAGYIGRRRSNLPGRVRRRRTYASELMCSFANWRYDRSN